MSKGSIFTSIQRQLEKSYAHFFTESNCVRRGRALHARILKTFPTPTLYLSNSLVNFYSKNGTIADARKLFDEMPCSQRDIVSYNTLIHGYSKNFESELSVFHSFELLRDMDVCGVVPDEVSFAGLVKCCVNGRGSGRNFEKGLMVHSVICKLGYDGNAFVANGFVEFYGSFGLVDESKKVLDCVEYKDAILISSMMGLLSGYGCFEEAFWLLRDYLLGCCMVPCRGAFVNLLVGASKCWHLTQGLQVHALIIKYGFERHGAVENSLVRMYSNCGCAESAMDLLVNSGSREVESWTTMIICCRDLGLFDKAVELFCQFYSKVQRLDELFLSSGLSTAADFQCLEHGKEVHSLAIKCGLESSTCVTISLMDMYAKCGVVEDALKIFQSLGSLTNLVAWTTITSCYVYNGLPMEALLCFHQMVMQGIMPDMVACLSVLTGCTDLQAVFLGKQIHAFLVKSDLEMDISAQTSLLSLYSDSGNLHEAIKQFRLMAERDVVSWTSLISAYVNVGQSEDALVLLVNMIRDGISPNNYTLTSTLTASGKIASSQMGNSLHSIVIKVGVQEDKFIETALVDMYCKCGNVKSAVTCFRETSRQDIYLWNSLLNGYACHGSLSELLKAFQEMQDCGIKPDSVTFLAVLTGCSRSGQADNSIPYYIMMRDHYEIEPQTEHCACVVDGLGRAGLFKDAVNFIQLNGMNPGPELLRTLISSCITYGYIKLGLAAAAKMILLGQTVESLHVLVSSYTQSMEDGFIQDMQGKQ